MNKITNFQLYNFYEQEIKITSEDIKDICIHAMNLLKMTGLEKDAGEESIVLLKNIIDIILEKHELDFDNEDCKRLTYITNTSKNYSKLTKDDSGKYTCYPFSVSTPNYYDIIINHCLINNSSIEESAEILCNLIDVDNKQKANDILTSDLNFYYGNVHYILSRSLAIVDAIKMLLEREDLSNEDKTLVANIHQQAAQTFNNMTLLANISDLNIIREDDYSNKQLITSKQNYEQIVILYKNLLEFENTLGTISQQIWNNFYLNNDGMIIHKLTGGIVESDKMDKICTFFLSDKAQYVPAYLGNTGYCYNLDINSVLSLCENDVGSWRITKEEFIRRECPSTIQLDESNIWYEHPYHSKLFSPEYIENKVLQRKEFAEIVLNNSTIKNKPLFAFYTPEATEEEIKKITKIALEQNIEVKPLSFNKQNNFNK